MRSSLDGTTKFQNLALLLSSLAGSGGLAICWTTTGDPRLLMSALVPINLLRLLIAAWLFIPGPSASQSLAAAILHAALRPSVHNVLTLLITILLLIGFSVHKRRDDEALAGTLPLLLAVGELMLLVVGWFGSSVQDAVPVAVVHLKARTWSAQDTVMCRQTACVICLEDYEEGELVGQAPCSHIFHDHCYRNWQNQDKSRKGWLCPLRCAHPCETIGVSH
eukprot:TRINITY_DN93365_c0_g1_i1.p1 TRINITY_DN93365_c0_g1~~TRINITY_DN93365_c0_g1_i1.p1  ORF type:complete len:221 (-),score=18.78 TRINITY_DN93365_c0_g1_i1:33-695(-)